MIRGHTRQSSLLLAPYMWNNPRLALRASVACLCLLAFSILSLLLVCKLSYAQNSAIFWIFRLPFSIVSLKSTCQKLYLALFPLSCAPLSRHLNVSSSLLLPAAGSSSHEAPGILPLCCLLPPSSLVHSQAPHPVQVPPLPAQLLLCSSNCSSSFRMTFLSLRLSLIHPLYCLEVILPKQPFNLVAPLTQRTF